MRAIVGLALILSASACATNSALLAMNDPDPAVKHCLDSHPRQKDLTLRRQRVKQARARGLSSAEDEYRIALYKDEIRAECETNRAGSSVAPPDEEE
jgi:hypothetical protein